MKRTLLALAVWDPKTGYVQGLHFLAALTAVATARGTDAESFRLLAVLTREPVLRGLLRVEFPVFQGLCSLFDRLLAETQPALAKHLGGLGITSDLFLFAWAQSLFLKALPMHAALHVVDAFLVHGPRALLAAADAVLRQLAALLLRSDFEAALRTLTVGAASHAMLLGDGDGGAAAGEEDSPSPGGHEWASIDGVLLQ